jgi:polyferredoxin
MTRPRRPVPEPVETNDVLIAAIGAVAFAVAFLVLLIVPLDAGDRWWRWVCLTGFAMGAFGCWYVPRLQRRRREAAERRAHHDEDQHAG